MPPFHTGAPVDVGSVSFGFFWIGGGVPAKVVLRLGDWPAALVGGEVDWLPVDTFAVLVALEDFRNKVN